MEILLGCLLEGTCGLGETIGKMLPDHVYSTSLSGLDVSDMMEKI